MDGLYLHIPFCASKCAYCAFVSGVYDEDVRHRYVDRLIEELCERANEVGMLDTVYIGGGTPGILAVSELNRLFCAIRERFRLAKDTEFTFETNPETVTAELCEALSSAGINRVSMGLQAPQGRLLRAVGRRHTFEDFTRALRLLTEVGIRNLSGDLMLGLPGQTADDLEETFCRVRDLPLTHWSVYGLAVEAGTPLAASGYTANDDFEADLYGLAVERLSEQGFGRYETSNFARPGFECRHNLKYWTLGNYLGAGVAAHSDTGGVRSCNTSELNAYLASAPRCVEAESQRDREEEFVMLSLRLERGLNCAEYRRRFGTEFSERYAVPVRRLCALGALIEDENVVRIPPERAYVANSVIASLFAGANSTEI